MVSEIRRARRERQAEHIPHPNQEFQDEISEEKNEEQQTGE
jgi:hypothetical protein